MIAAALTSPPDQDRRAEHVDEEREVLRVLADGCEERAHAPGFQIMSIDDQEEDHARENLEHEALRRPVQGEQLAVRPRLGRRVQLLRLLDAGTM